MPIKLSRFEVNFRFDDEMLQRKFIKQFNYYSERLGFDKQSLANFSFGGVGYNVAVGLVRGKTKRTLDNALDLLDRNDTQDSYKDMEELKQILFNKEMTQSSNFTNYVSRIKKLTRTIEQSTDEWKQNKARKNINFPAYNVVYYRDYNLAH